MPISARRRLSHWLFVSRFWPLVSSLPIEIISAFMESAKILILSVAAAIAYGIVHDQVTAHLCVEYFTIGHPPVFGTTSPVLLAVGWGIIATWWVGLLLGVVLAVAAQAGSRPRR